MCIYTLQPQPLHSHLGLFEVRYLSGWFGKLPGSSRCRVVTRYTTVKPSRKSVGVCNIYSVAICVLTTEYIHTIWCLITVVNSIKCHSRCSLAHIRSWQLLHCRTRPEGYTGIMGVQTSFIVWFFLYLLTLSYLEMLISPCRKDPRYQRAATQITTHEKQMVGMQKYHFKK